MHYPVENVTGSPLEKGKLIKSEARRVNMAGLSCFQPLVSFHPETPDEKRVVSGLERINFSFWQGNQEIARRRTFVRRTSKTAD